MSGQDGEADTMLGTVSRSNGDGPAAALGEGQTAEEAMNRVAELRALRTELTRFMLSYKFGLAEMMTKIRILEEEFAYAHEYSPIEHVNSRLKSPESILRKAARRECPLTLADIRKNILDIAGIRIVCSFVADTYKVAEMLGRQADVTVVEVKDYIANPKPNGYKSLHMIVQVPVFMSDHVQPVSVEIQIRTIAMDFWASLEHKIFYKFATEVPPQILDELKEAARVADELDAKMQALHLEVRELAAGLGSAAADGAPNDSPFVPLLDGLLHALAADTHVRTGSGRSEPRG